MKLLFSKFDKLFKNKNFNIFFSKRFIQEIEEFEELDLLQDKSKNVFRVNEKVVDKIKKNIPVKELPLDLDWSSYWPASRSYVASAVPLPIYQGVVKTRTRFIKKVEGITNTELIKIPNFLHLTPKTIKVQTNALKKFCTNWPKELDTDESCEEHFPLEIVTQDRIHASPTIRDPKARKIKIKFNLNKLKFDEHAKDKFIKLLKHRYDKKTNMVTITVEACPFKKQNIDFALYQLTACYFESFKTEPWELENNQK